MKEEGIELIKKFEGCKLKAYLCPAGVVTIGYGDTKNVSMGMTITQEEADRRLADRYLDFEEGVLAMLKVSLNQNQLGALVSFAYNVGLNNLKNSTLLKKVNASDFEGASAEFGKWIYANKKPLPGLATRRLAEKALFMKSPEILVQEDSPLVKLLKQVIGNK